MFQRLAQLAIGQVGLHAVAECTVLNNNSGTESEEKKRSYLLNQRMLMSLWDGLPGGRCDDKPHFCLLVAIELVKS